MDMNTVILIEKEKNGKAHRYFVLPGSTKGEVYDVLTEWRQEIFASIQQDMANDAAAASAAQAVASPVVDIAAAPVAPQEPQSTDVQP